MVNEPSVFESLKFNCICKISADQIRVPISTLKMLCKQQIFLFWIFQRKIGFDMSCKLYLKEKILHEMSTLFFWKKREYLKYRLLKFLPSMLKVNVLDGCSHVWCWWWRIVLLEGLDAHKIIFIAIFSARETVFMTSCLLSCTSSPFWKGVFSKSKEFAPKGSKFFPFRVDPFLENALSANRES